VRASLSYDGSLEGLFDLLDEPEARDSFSIQRRGGRFRRPVDALIDHHGNPRDSDQPGLFDQEEGLSVFDPLTHPRSAGAGAQRRLGGTSSRDRLCELCPSAAAHFVRAWASELPIEAEAIHYARLVLLAAESQLDPLLARRMAEAASLDRGDPATGAVLAASYKVSREYHRLIGLLRFSPTPSGIWLARCACDHYQLHALGYHFADRFGSDRWAIVDERRSLAVLWFGDSERPFTVIPSGNLYLDALGEDPWEDLWRRYHRAVSIASRENRDLQAQFMPRRYWKYLVELYDEPLEGSSR